MIPSLYEKALDEAYKERVAHLFATFVADLILDTKGCEKSYRDGLALLNRAYELAKK